MASVGHASSRQESDGQVSNGVEHESNMQSEKPNRFRNAVHNLSANWFVLPMNSGILGILMHQLPWQFNGLGIISSVMFVWTLVQFVVLAVAFLFHCVRDRKTAARKLLENPDEMYFLGAAPIALFTITALIALNVTSTDWGGRAWSFVAYTLWWIGVAWMLATSFGVCIVLFRKELSDLRSMSVVVCIPVVGLATAAVAGGIVSNYAYHLRAGPAVPVIIVSFLLAGIALWLAMMIYTLIFLSMISYGWPKAQRRPLMVMLVGPAGQTAAALLLLGTASAKQFGIYNAGSFITASAASALQSACVLFALLLLGLDVFWIAVSLWGIIEGTLVGGLEYSMAWWATIFPLGTTTTTFILLSESLDSDTFRGFATAFLIILVIDYLINLAFTGYYVIRGDLLFDKKPLNLNGRHTE